MAKVGIAGCGVVGGALSEWLVQNTNHKLYYYDPPKNLKAKLKDCDFVFMCVPVPTRADYSQDTSILEDVLEQCGKNTQVLIRSTVLPGTNDRLGTISCPEFLTERVSNQDLNDLDVMVGHKGIEFIEDIFPGKPFRSGSNKECELAKYAHNVFGAMKVNFFNHVHKLCTELGADYHYVNHLMDITGFIDPNHREVPGPDGKFGFGGKCFPKDLEAFFGWCKEDLFHQIILDNKRFSKKPTA